jgi:hypothetical protein
MVMVSPLAGGLAFTAVSVVVSPVFTAGCIVSVFGVLKLPQPDKAKAVKKTIKEWAQAVRFINISLWVKGLA